MNGIVFYDKQGLPVGPLTPNILFKALETGEFADWPLLTITKEEIEDKSKSDFFTKSILVLQTIWFTVKCIGRIADGLSLAELEVITFAFATMNIVTFVMWLHKPQNINLPIPVTLTPPQIVIYSSLQAATVSNNNRICLKRRLRRTGTKVGFISYSSHAWVLISTRGRCFHASRGSSKQFAYLSCARVKNRDLQFVTCRRGMFSLYAWPLCL